MGEGGCAAYGSACFVVGGAFCEKEAKKDANKDKEKNAKCDRVCWEVKNGCSITIYCNGHALYSRFVLSHSYECTNARCLQSADQLYPSPRALPLERVKEMSHSHFRRL